MLATETPTLRWVTIYMADNEWDNGQNMDLIARERFETDANPDTLLIEVREHAGWFCEYGWDADGLVRLGSANCANRSPRADAYRESKRGMRHEYIGGKHR